MSVSSAGIEPDGLPTELAEIRGAKPIHPFYEVQVTRPGQQEYHLPFFAATIELCRDAPSAFPEGTSWTVGLENEAVFLRGPGGAKESLAAGQSRDLEGARLTLVDIRRPPVAFLQAISDSLGGRVWPLNEQQMCVGRRGKRINHIELTDTTVSRAHATFLPGPSGTMELLNETSAPTLVNGEAMAAGDRVALKHGDILALGASLFRFRSAREGAAGDQVQLSLRTLGTFFVELGSKPIPWDSTNPKAAWLLALLASRWGDSVSVEWIIGNFWPDANTSRARKNLGLALKRIREALGMDEEDFEDLVLRTTASLSLNPKRLGSHDFTEVKEATQGFGVLSSYASLKRVCDLYQGDFLLDCYEEWAEVERTKLRLEFLETLLRTARHFAERSEIDAVKLAVSKIHELEPAHLEATRILMEAALAAGKPEVALEAYRSVEQMLARDGLEPDIELMRLKYRVELAL